MTPSAPNSGCENAFMLPRGFGVPLEIVADIGAQQSQILQRTPSLLSWTDKNINEKETSFSLRFPLELCNSLIRCGQYVTLWFPSRYRLRAVMKCAPGLPGTTAVAASVGRMGRAAFGMSELGSRLEKPFATEKE
ncbi:hypothetical protein MRX96_052514 [Rhipicephalus microplus]